MYSKLLWLGITQQVYVKIHKICVDLRFLKPAVKNINAESIFHCGYIHINKSPQLRTTGITRDRKVIVRDSHHWSTWLIWLFVVIFQSGKLAFRCLLYCSYSAFTRLILVFGAWRSYLDIRYPAFLWSDNLKNLWYRLRLILFSSIINRSCYGSNYVTTE